MGTSWSQSHQQPPPGHGRVTSPPSGVIRQQGFETTAIGNRRKRHSDEMSEEDIEELSPKRKKIQTTSNYIYETLFKHGANSDITISALGKEWKLHKVYLCQCFELLLVRLRAFNETNISGYFSSMFSGNWRESKETWITLDIPDSNITAAALETAFSSLYRDQVHLEESQVCPLLAAATMLQLDGLLEHCKEFMRENMTPERVVPYITAATLYGLKDLKQECRNWLKVHLVKSYNVAVLKDLSVELLTELLKSWDLYVMQVEMDVYTLAKRWLFLELHPDWSGELDKLLTDAEQYFREYSSRNDNKYFLEYGCGQQYAEVFRAVRVQHILNDVVSVRTLETDRIIPKSWMLNLYRTQWLTMVTVDQRLDPGPAAMSVEQFKTSSVRCGRVIYEPGEYCWRWTGFSFGFDVLIMYNSTTGTINVKRNTRTQPCVSAVSMQPSRMITISLRATSCDVNGTMATCLDTGIHQVTLTHDQEYQLLIAKSSVIYPLYISVNLSLTSADYCNDISTSSLEVI